MAKVLEDGKIIIGTIAIFSRKTWLIATFGGHFFLKDQAGIYLEGKQYRGVYSASENLPFSCTMSNCMGVVVDVERKKD